MVGRGWKGVGVWLRRLEGRWGGRWEVRGDEEVGRE